jgi:exopolysaccharide biosynthesis polyprenyl glycosylphosphotransferase
VVPSRQLENGVAVGKDHTMPITRRRILLTLFKLLDLAIMVASFGLATIPILYQSHAVSLSEFFSLRVTIQNFIIFLGFVLAWHLLFVALGLYQSRRLVAARSEILDILKGTSLGTAVIAIAAVLFQIRMANATFLAAFWMISSTGEVASRLALRYVLRRIREKGHNLRHLLIVGTGPHAMDFARKATGRPELGYQLVGFSDDRRAENNEFRESGYNVVCDLTHFVEFIRKNVVDEVVIALPITSRYFQVSRIAELCQEQGIVVRFLKSALDLRMAGFSEEDFEADSLVTLYGGPLGGWPVLAKRVLDFTIALVVLILLSPVFLLTSLLIRLSSPGPVLFTQERLGLNKRRFRIYKFRTMVPDAEKRLAEVGHMNEVSGPVFKIKNDPRLTPVGKILRKSSIDELPQLLNVLKGDMSLVGPRPLPVRDYEGFDQDWHRRRFSVRPGITCLWQISGRSAISFDRWMELDMQYIDQWSLWLDFKILVGTIPAVLKGSGAA